jgi:hypothetical protein
MKAKSPACDVSQRLNEDCVELCYYESWPGARAHQKRAFVNQRKRPLAGSHLRPRSRFVGHWAVAPSVVAMEEHRFIDGMRQV